MTFQAAMVPTVIQAFGGVTAILALRALYQWWTGYNGSGLPYPPGPKGYPIINNLFDMPIEVPWAAHAELAKKYGDLIFFRVFGQPIMIVASEKRAVDLFEKRSTIYSNRPHSVMMHELLEFDNFFGLVNYGPRWRKHRRMFHQEFNHATVPKYHPIVKCYTHRFLVALSDGVDLSEATRNAIAGMGIQVLYGLHVNSIDHPFISDASNVGDALNTAGVPGRFLVDVFPALKHVPRWVPGAGFQRWADHYRAASRNVLDQPFEYVWNLHVSRTIYVDRGTTAMIDRFPEDPVQRHEQSLIARNVCSQTHLAAGDTTYGMMMAFFLAMVLHPNVQRAAQTELDRVAGPFTAPDFSHRPDLDYIEAVLRETFRWHQVLPLALPHCVTEDNIYDGYFIPKGTVVFGNSWGLMHDPDVFPNPMEFKPERFLTKEGKINAEVPEPMALFGYGRRICPGRHFAADVMYSFITATLASFNVLPGRDEHGNPVKVEAKFEGGAIMKPAPFECEFELRSPQVVVTLEDLKRTMQ